MKIKENYLRESTDNNFDFNSFDSSDTFYYKHVFDIFKFKEKAYLEDNHIPYFNILKPKPKPENNRLI